MPYELQCLACNEHEACAKYTHLLHSPPITARDLGAIQQSMVGEHGGSQVLIQYPEEWSQKPTVGGMAIQPTLSSVRIYLRDFT